MKIAIFTDVFLEVPGGIPSSIRAQMQSLQELGHEVTVFCPGWKKDHDDYAIVNGKLDKNVIVVPTHKFLSPGGAPLSRAPEIVEKFVIERVPVFTNFDLVHVHYEGSCSIAGMHLARKFKLPLVQTMHGREDMAIAVNVPHPFKTIAACALCWLHSMYIPHSKKVHKDDKLTRGSRSFALAPTIARARMWELMINHANYADQVITPSLHFANKLKHYGVKKPVTVVSNGVSDQMIQQFEQKTWRKLGKKSRASTNDFLVRTMKDGDKLKMIWNSRVSNEKRLLPFLKAMALMNIPATLSVYGDGNELKKCKLFVKKYKLDGTAKKSQSGYGKKVKFYGYTKHERILDKMLDSHLSITNSYGFDTQGLTLLEAEATGLPVFYVDPDMQEIVPKSGSINCDTVLEKTMQAWIKKTHPRFHKKRMLFINNTAPSPELTAAVLTDLARHPERIEKMSRAMLKHREKVYQSTQIKNLLKVYNKCYNK